MFQRHRTRPLKLNSAHFQLLRECRSIKDFKICRDVLVPLCSTGKKKNKSLFLRLARCAIRDILIKPSPQIIVLHKK